MEKGKFVELSQPFWNSYKLFLKGEIPLTKLRKNFNITNDILFFKEECDETCDVFKCLEELRRKKLNAFIYVLLTVMKKLGREKRGYLLKKYLCMLLSQYACFTTGETKKICNNIIFFLNQKIKEVPRNHALEQRHLELLHLFITARDLVEDREAFMRPIARKIVCIYAALASSDSKGTTRCRKLGKKISKDWGKLTPENETLAVLQKIEIHRSRLPIGDGDLLDMYSF